MATMISTTLAAAVGAFDQNIPLSSYTGVTPPGPPSFTETLLYCEREAMCVIKGGVNPVARVVRGYAGTVATPHPAAAVVWVGPPVAFGTSDPSGTFSQPQGGYTPLVVIPTGNIWNDVGGVWSIVGGDSGEVLSVFGRTGNVVAVANDYDITEIENAGTAAAKNTGAISGTVPLFNASLFLPGLALGNLGTVAAGTAYSLTNTAGLLTFGTTSPTVTVSVAGTYMLFAQVKLDYVGATFAGNQTVTLKIRRTNNTAADVTDSTQTFVVPIITALTYTAGVIDLPPVTYTTALTSDILQVWGSIGTAPAAGSVDATAAVIRALRIG